MGLAQKLFTKGTAALALSLGLLAASVAQENYRQTFIPENALPQGFDNLYENMRKVTTLGRAYYPHKNHVRLAPRLGPSGIPEIDAIDAASPAEAEKMAHAFIRSGKFGNFKNLNHPRKLRIAVSLLEAIAHDGLTPFELNFQTRFQNNYRPTKAYETYVKNRLKTAFQDLCQNDDFKKFLALAAQFAGQAITKEKAVYYYWTKRRGLQVAADKIKRAFNLDNPVRVFVDAIPEDIGVSGLYGVIKQSEMQPGLKAPDELDGKAIIIIEHSPPRPATELIAHETGHDVNQNMMDLLERGQIAKGDVRFEHAVALTLNRLAYSITLKTDCSRNRKACAKYEKDHLQQYYERSVHMYEKAMNQFILLSAPEKSCPVNRRMPA